MSLVTYGKNGRVYQRAFDHDEAIALHAADPKTWTLQRLAEHFGVSDSAIDRVVNPRRRKQMQEHSNRWLHENRREPCKGGCGRLVWTTVKGRSGLCPRCLGLSLATTVRPDSLRCSACHEWKPDAEFPRKRATIARRGRHQECRRCQTITRQRRRLARAIPCVRCGKLRSYDTGAKARGDSDTGLCLACYREVELPEHHANLVAASVEARRKRAAA